VALQRQLVALVAASHAGAVSRSALTAAAAAAADDVEAESVAAALAVLVSSGRLTEIGGGAYQLGRAAER